MITILKSNTLPPAPYEHSRQALLWPGSQWPPVTSRTNVLRTASSVQSYPKKIKRVVRM